MFSTNRTLVNSTLKEEEYPMVVKELKASSEGT